ncbi:hypothetical protein GCM10010168_72190 [Actinoplanes ianthinogenes]|uniref:Glycosyltransferase n=1 Tax=Actinoplanes ianthinogenes TaxID=122358 RepID=A0ABM7M6D8_9ACTN|nr:hypothetical protein [Actinoplanes ianthinogenes]BCJ47192.1 hypothetical protein Aiant_78490 [Actinoplanes ianthinogenes]GGR42770.1 hypothetical protein GCM10010168_72190 [Actinoplanes ianthinogenes]
MIVCYARGGGLGHLTRIRAYLHTVHDDEPATILTDSGFAGDPRVLGPHRVLPPAALPSLKPSVLVVDAFPFGIDGELVAMPRAQLAAYPLAVRTALARAVRTVHLARLLRWDAYRSLLPAEPIEFDQTWILEDLHPAHAAHLARTSVACDRLSLSDPPSDSDSSAADGVWLIAHAGPPSEIHDLLAYARECAELERCRPRLMLAAPGRPAGLPGDVEHTDRYPVWPLFAGADRVITAAGFNAVRQMAPWRDKHRMLPFPRRWDDQFTRASRARQW